MEKALPAGRGGGLPGLRRIVVILAAAAFVVMLVLGGPLLRERIVEELDLRVVARGEPGEQARALARLLERGSMRAVPHLLEQVLDPALERRLEATVEAIHDLRLGRSGSTRERDFIRVHRPRSEAKVEFTGVDRDTLDFLESPRLRPAVQFGCTSPWAPYDEALEAELDDGQPAVRAEALAVLLRVRAPSSVEDQWHALESLRRSRLPREWGPLLARMASLFEAESVLDGLAGQPPWLPYTDPPARLAWSIRAAGATRLAAALPRLRELSLSTHLDTARAARRSIEDLEGPEAHPRPWHPGERELDESLQAVRHLQELFPLEEGRR